MKQGENRRCIATLLAFVASALFLCGCADEVPSASPAPTAAAPSAAASAPSQAPGGTKTSTEPMIVAEPNPVPAGTGPGKTTIRWDTGNGAAGQVFVSEEGGEESLFGENSRGSKEANWIGRKTYEFRLYAGKDRKTQLASVTVTRK